MFKVSLVQGCKLIPLYQFEDLDYAEVYCMPFVSDHFIISEVDKDGNYITDVVKEITPQIE